MKKLKLEKRDITGKKVKSLREKGLTPAVVYNSKGESSNVALSNTDSSWLYRNATSTTILDSEVDGREFKCLVKEFGVNSMTGEINHVSIFEIDDTAPMVFTIPFNIVGISPAVKNNIGILVQALDDIEVKCQLSKLQPSIDIDISTLTHPGQTITVEDIKLPEGMALINEDMQTAAIITIADAQKIEEAAIADAEEAAATLEAQTEAETEETADEDKEETEGEESTDEQPAEE
jgi:large subunit ribosomal protein L25